MKDLSIDVMEARKLGLSYGTYSTYKATGFLEQYREDFEAKQQLEKMHKRRIVPSNIIGGRSQNGLLTAAFGTVRR